jgi:UDP-2,3-diacylglucosamine pyrophosphatase LpxH
MVKYRTIWLSDIHLGSKEVQADALLEFLKNSQSDYLFLVGDILDFWKKRMYWPTAYNTIVQKILKKARHGTKVFFIHGNHDSALSPYVGLKFGDVELCKEYTHTLSSGSTLWCTHGDDFDMVTRYHVWVAKLGDVGYELLLRLNKHFNHIRKLLNLPYWSLSMAVKHKVKDAVNFINDYEANLILEASKRNVSGVVCGHIHKAELRRLDSIIYGNCGDWVENCTALVETDDGKLQLITHDFKILKELE